MLDNTNVLFIGMLIAFAIGVIGISIWTWLKNKRTRDIIDLQLKFLSELVKEKEKEV